MGNIQKVSWEIIGVGNMGSGHLAIFFPVQLAGEWSHRGCGPCRKSQGLGAGTPGRGCERRLCGGRRLIASGACEAVIIAVPHLPASGLAIEGLRTPNARDVRKARRGIYQAGAGEMNEGRGKGGLVFGMIFNQRTNPTSIARCMSWSTVESWGPSSG